MNDLRLLPFNERKVKLRSLMAASDSRLLNCDHIEGRGCGLHSLACKDDLKGIVAKHRYGLCSFDDLNTTWLKIRKSN
jgi:ATP-dependent DNA ligase